ncbi:hypothetical protein ACP4OV_025992 [Aristida adscensionis]
MASPKPTSQPPHQVLSSVAAVAMGGQEEVPPVQAPNTAALGAKVEKEVEVVQEDEEEEVEAKEEAREEDEDDNEEVEVEEDKEVGGEDEDEEKVDEDEDDDEEVEVEEEEEVGGEDEDEEEVDGDEDEDEEELEVGEKEDAMVHAMTTNGGKCMEPFVALKECLVEHCGQAIFNLKTCIQKEMEKEEEWCMQMKAGSCRDPFVALEECVEAAKEDGANYAERCVEAALNLKDCMEAHINYYGPPAKRHCCL